MKNATNETAANETIVMLNLEELPSDCFVFKHSTRCPVSFAASDAVKGAKWSPTLFWVNVVEQRSLSNWISEHLGVEHESPQLVRVEGGKVTQVFNHREIPKAISSGL